MLNYMYDCLIDELLWDLGCKMHDGLGKHDRDYRIDMGLLYE